MIMYTMTMTASRHRLPWSMSETNRLYSEYEMKQLPISNIAQLHARTEYAILHKLAQEFLINASWNDVKGWNAPKEMTQSKSKVSYDYEEDCESEYEEDDHDSDSDYDENENENEYEKKSVVSDDESLEDCDDPNDSDYVDEEEEDDDDDSSDYEEEEEFDAYSIPQKASAFRKVVDAAKFFIYAA